MEEYIRNCPKCDIEIKHKSKYNHRDAKLEGRLCKSCMLKGRNQKELYGDEYDNIINKRKSTQKETGWWWHDKIAENRKARGTNKLSDEHKKWISENSYFNNTGENHVRIKKILIEQNITYEQYLDRLDDYKRYKREVTLLTNKIDISNLENSEKRGKCGVPNAYQLDHIQEISEGYILGIPPQEIAQISNLQFIPWELNSKKRKYPNGIHNNKIKNYYGKSKN